LVTSVLIGLAVVGCSAPAAGNTASSSPSNPPAATPTSDLSKDEAISVARGYGQDIGKDATVWYTMSGQYGDVYAALAHAATPDMDAPTVAASTREVWGVEFMLPSVEICGPEGTTCEKRDVLRTVFIDAKTGEWLTTAAFAPKPGDPLPKP